MVAPARRFALAGEERVAPVAVLDRVEDRPSAPAPRTFTRRVSGAGRISFEDHAYHVGVWLAGEAVELSCRAGLLEIVHRGVLIAAHARRQPHKAAAPLGARPPGPRQTRPQTAGRPVLRKVGSGGAISFAGASYRVGNARRCEQVEVRLVGDTVEISQAAGSSRRTRPDTTAAKSTAPSRRHEDVLNAATPLVTQAARA
jgi:hypothetical protein